MSRYIDADAFVADARMVGLDTAEKVFFALVHQPSIDIVRCAECKYKQQCIKAVQHTTHEPTSVTIAYRPIDSCSYGEREGE